MHVWQDRVATLPADFVRKLKREKTRTANFDTAGAFKAGSRNNELTKIAGSLRFRGLAETAIAGALQAINAAACSPPLDTDEVGRIASSVGKYETGHEEAFGWLGDVEESTPQGENPHDRDPPLENSLSQGAAGGGSGSGPETSAVDMTPRLPAGRAPLKKRLSHPPPVVALCQRRIGHRAERLGPTR